MDISMWNGECVLITSAALSSIIHFHLLLIRLQSKLHFQSGLHGFYQSLQDLPLRAVSHSWPVQSSDGSENHVRHVADLPGRSCTIPKYSQQVSINNMRMRKSLKRHQAAAVFWPLSHSIQVEGCKDTGSDTPSPLQWNSWHLNLVSIRP